MKVVQVSQSYHPRPGGVTEHVDHITRELRRRGHDVTVITSSFGAQCPPEPGVVRVGRNVLIPINGAWVNTTIGWNLSRQLSQLLSSLKPDIIHTHCPLAPTLPLMALKSAPRTSRVIGTFHAAAERSAGYQVFRNLLARLAERLDTRIAVSEAARSLASSYFPGDYLVVPNGVDCERFSPRHSPLHQYEDGAFNVLFVGRMDKRKGLKHLFRAVTLASRNTSRQLRLIVVGDDGLRRHLLPSLPPTVDLVFTGVVDRNLLPRYFATGDVFCSPAIDRESFGIVLLEAMASGVPVVATAIPGYLTILRDDYNSLVVPPADEVSLSRAILRLMEDDPLRWKLTNNALKFSRAYHWQRVVDQLEAVYRRQQAEWDWRADQPRAVHGTVKAGAQKV